MKTVKKTSIRQTTARTQKEPPPAVMPAHSPRWPAWLLTAGAVLLILHGIIELLPALMVFAPNTNQIPEFIFEDLAAHWQMTLGFSIVCGLLRLAAAVGILKNLKWGWMLGIILSVITFAVLTLYLPMGIMDAVFSGPVLLLLLIGRYPEAKISG
jgi:hypothetical protein